MEYATGLEIDNFWRKLCPGAGLLPVHPHISHGSIAFVRWLADDAVGTAGSHPLYHCGYDLIGYTRAFQRNQIVQTDRIPSRLSLHRADDEIFAQPCFEHFDNRVVCKRWLSGGKGGLLRLPTNGKSSQQEAEH